MGAYLNRLQPRKASEVVRCIEDPVLLNWAHQRQSIETSSETSSLETKRSICDERSYYNDPVAVSWFREKQSMETSSETSLERPELKELAENDKRFYYNVLRKLMDPGGSTTYTYPNYAQECMYFPPSSNFKVHELSDFFRAHIVNVYGAIELVNVPIDRRKDFVIYQDIIRYVPGEPNKAIVRLIGNYLEQVCDNRVNDRVFESVSCFCPEIAALVTDYAVPVFLFLLKPVQEFAEFHQTYHYLWIAPADHAIDNSAGHAHSTGSDDASALRIGYVKQTNTSQGRCRAPMGPIGPIACMYRKPMDNDDIKTPDDDQSLE